MIAKNAALPLRVYGYAIVNSDGTVTIKSPNITVVKGSVGNYVMQPADHFVNTDVLPVAISSSNVPFLPSCQFGLGATDDGVLVSVFNVSASPAVAVDAPFYFVLFTIGNNDRSTIPTVG